MHGDQIASDKTTYRSAWRYLGDQEVRVGDVFVECIEKTGLPGFGFFRQGDTRVLRGEDSSRRTERKSYDQKDGGWGYTELDSGVQNGNPG